MKFHPDIQAFHEKVLAGTKVTPLEVVDAAIVHAKHQGRFSSSPEGSCHYRHTDAKGETACLAGALIPDKRYKKVWEGSAVDMFALPRSLKAHVNLLYSLQRAHDENTPRTKGELWAARRGSFPRMIKALDEIRASVVAEAVIKAKQAA